LPRRVKQQPLNLRIKLSLEVGNKVRLRVPRNHIVAVIIIAAAVAVVDVADVAIVVVADFAVAVGGGVAVGAVVCNHWARGRDYVLKRVVQPVFDRVFVQQCW
jgi:uncharacterized protein (DUF736 family)